MIIILFCDVCILGIYARNILICPSRTIKPSNSSAQAQKESKAEFSISLPSFICEILSLASLKLAERTSYSWRLLKAAGRHGWMHAHAQINVVNLPLLSFNAKGSISTFCCSWSCILSTGFTLWHPIVTFTEVMNDTCLFIWSLWLND
jgi:hypothetical protein